MQKKYLGVINEILLKSKKELSNKQDQMEPLTADDIKSMVPPFSVKEELSKTAPIQITLLGENDQLLSKTDFSINKDNTVQTSGITNDNGLCIYDNPKIMDASIMPCSLQYNEHVVELSVPDGATYADIEIREDTMNITNTDGNNGPDILNLQVGSLNNLLMWDYTLNDTDNTITLNYLISGKKVADIYEAYDIDGKIYITKFAEYNNQPYDGTGSDYMFLQRKYVTINVYANNDIYLPVNSSGFFANSIITATTNIEKLNTSKVENMTCMFYGMKSSGSFNLFKQGFILDTSNVISMDAMCMDSETPTLMFYGDLSKFDTSKVTSMHNMFARCGAISPNILNKMNTSHVTDMSNMFSNSTAITLSLISFDTSNVVNMEAMFSGATKLTKINTTRGKWIIPSGCKTTNMFYNCGVKNVTYVS